MTVFTGLVFPTSVSGTTSSTQAFTASDKGCLPILATGANLNSGVTAGETAGTAVYQTTTTAMQLAYAGTTTTLTGIAQNDFNNLIYSSQP